MRSRHALLLAAVAVLSSLGCRDDGPTGLAGTPRDGRVFIDDFIAADFQAFGGSKLDAVQLDNVTKFRGTSALRVTVPAPTDPTGNYAGGAFVAAAPRDLTGYNALTFYVRSSVAATLNVAGIGNDNTGNSRFTAERNNIPTTTAWQRVVVPIPLASRLTAEQGLFYFAEGAEGAAGYEIWLDDIQFVTLDSITNPRPVITPATVAAEVGASQTLSNIPVTFAVGTADVVISAMPAYFQFTSSNTAVATVAVDGRSLNVVGAGSTNVTAALGGVAATGQITVQSVSPPTVAAPTPTYAAGDVISLFSNAYTNVPVNTWRTDWSDATLTDRVIAGNDVKRYTNLTFVGIETVGANRINATAMTHFRIDVWTPDAITGTAAVRVKLVDWGANGNYDGPGVGDDVEHELTFNGTTSPAVTSGTWITLDIPLSQFTGLTTRANMAQFIISGVDALNTLYVDNVLFHR
jgi:hypothetical protein